MRTLSLKLTAALTGRKPKPPIPDADLTALKEQARALLNQQADIDADADALGWHDLHGTQPVPTPAIPRPPVGPVVDDLGLKETPKPAYDPGRSRIQPVVKYPLFGTVPTGEMRLGLAVLPRFAAPWDVAWAHLTDAERAWSSGGTS